MMADKKGGLFGVKMPSMPFGGAKKAAAKAETAADKTKSAANQFQDSAATAAKKVAEAPKKATAAPKKAAEKVAEAFMSLQPGDAGYVEPKAKSAPVQAVKAAAPTNVKKAAGKAADAVEDVVDSAEDEAKKTAKRGAALLREDLLKSAPERIGVGRQDETALAPPTYGEPGYVSRIWRRGLILCAQVRWGSGGVGVGGRRGSVDGYRCGSVDTVLKCGYRLRLSTAV